MLSGKLRNPVTLRPEESRLHENNIARDALFMVSLYRLRSKRS